MRKYIFFFASLGIVLFLNLYFRAFPVYFPQLKTQAKNIVENRIRQNVIQDIDRRFPEFSPLAKNTLIDVSISNYKKQKKQEIKKQAQEEYYKLKDRYQDAKGQTYLMELDCWHWARYVDNVLHLGHPGDKIVNGKQFDALMFAPLGSPVVWNSFLYYFSASLYKIFCLIKPVPLFTFLFYLPLFFMAIFIIILYLFCFYHWRNLCAIISCLFVGLAPIFLPRSCAGWFDTDILQLLFPLLIVWTYLKAFDAVFFRQRLLWICFSSFWLGLFCYTWINWWFIFFIIIIYEVYSLVNLIFLYLQYKEKKLDLFKLHLFSLLLFFIFSLFWIIVFSGPQPLLILYFQLKEAILLNKPLIASVWPNVLSTVGELRRADGLQIANSVGGVSLLLPSIVCMLALFLRTLYKRKYTGFERECIVILVFWFIGMVFACIKGIRFTMFLLIPLGVSLGWIINEAYQYFKNKKKKWIVSLVVAIIIVLGANLINNAYDTARGIFPLMNDNWYWLLTNLRQTTPSEAVINSWWDFGDWFKAVSGRRVIFDGQSANMPQAYWMAKVLISNDEEPAVRILKMLNNGGNSAFEIIDKQFKDPFKSVLLLEKVILAKTQEASKETLLKFLPSSTVEELIKLLFAQPDKAYFIVDYTMQGKMPPISYLGNWDFTKVYLAQNLNKKEKKQIVDYLKKLDRDNQEIERLYQEAGLISNEDLDHWISGQFNFYSGLINGQEKNNIVFFDGGLVYNLKTQAAYLYSERDKRYEIPRSLFVFENDKLKEMVYPNHDLNFSVLVSKTKEGYRAILLDPGLANSLFVRLYFLEGRGLKHFKPFFEEKDGPNYIRVFEIAWE